MLKWKKKKALMFGFTINSHKFLPSVWSSGYWSLSLSILSTLYFGTRLTGIKLRVRYVTVLGIVSDVWVYNQLTSIPPLPVWSRGYWNLTFWIFISSIFWYSDKSIDLNGRKLEVMSCHNSWCNRHLTIFTSRRQTKARTMNNWLHDK